MASPQLHQREYLNRRAQQLALVSVLYNLIEAGVAITVGNNVSSVALIGFGLDSIVEMSSGLVILWQFHSVLPEKREQQASRLISVSFYLLALFISLESIRTFLTRTNADTSTIGVLLALSSLIVMPYIAAAQRRTGQQLNSNSVVANSKQTLLCTYLSGVLLIGLILDATLGWWWADPIVGLVVAVLAISEGRNSWQGKQCAC